MNSRERVLAAIDHTEPDRVPIDIGGSIVTGIMAGALARLLPFLGLENQRVTIHDQFQMLGEVTPQIAEKLKVDVIPVEPEAISFNLRNRNFKPWRLFDGTEVLVPGEFNVEISSEGDWLMHDGGDRTRPVVARMPRNGFYFDQLSITGWDKDYRPPSVEELRRTGWRRLKEPELVFFQERARTLRESTDKALHFTNWGDATLGPAWIGSVAEWLVLLVTEKEYVRELMDLALETAIQNLKLYWQALGPNIDIISIDGYDLGSQRSELFSPKIFEEFYEPCYHAQCEWIHQNTPWKIFKHCCGSITRTIEPMIRAGIDILNPVQTSAVGMDPVWLKQQFGDRITFWGGGIDTQRILPFASSEEVYHHVADRLRVFAPGGGFIWSPIHNIQYNVPPENVMAALQAVYDFGKYPIR